LLLPRGDREKTAGATMVISVINHINIWRYETRVSYEKFSIFVVAVLY